MSDLVLAFRSKVDHGCLIVRDVAAEDDLSDWDPTVSNWHRVGDSIIFGVMPGSEGGVECEVFDRSPLEPLPSLLVKQEIKSLSRRLVVHDPNEAVRFEFRVRSEDVELAILVDNFDFASRVQIIAVESNGMGEAVD